MGHLSDLEVAVVQLQRQGFETRIFARRGATIICQVADVILSDRQIVHLFRNGKLDKAGLNSLKDSTPHDNAATEPSSSSLSDSPRVFRTFQVK